jgi:hypothetical protein
LEQASDRKFNEWADRTAKEHVRKGGNKGAIFLKERGQDPVSDALGKVIQQQARRKVN